MIYSACPALHPADRRQRLRRARRQFILFCPPTRICQRYRSASATSAPH